MKLKQLPGFCLFALFALAGCKKNSLKPLAKSEIDTGVFVSGNSSLGATLWKNGVATQLPGLPNSTFATTNTMTVNGRDVYIAGYAATTLNGINTTAVYWKNGVITALDPGNTAAAGAFSIAVSGTDVYVLGNVDNLGAGFGPNAAYWKNGVVTNLTNPAIYTSSQALGIAVSGPDVYVAGSIMKTTGHSEAVYWKNGVLNEITDGSKAAWATSVAVQNNNVFVTYAELHNFSSGIYSVAYYWENGVAVPLTNDLLFSIAGSMVVNGNDVYTTGYLGISGTQAVATYWKNNVFQKLPGSGLWDSADAIAISGNDVYVCGNSNAGAKYWKNGVAVQVGDATSPSNANGIAVIH